VQVKHCDKYFLGGVLVMITKEQDRKLAELIRQMEQETVKLTDVTQQAVKATQLSIQNAKQVKPEVNNG